MTKFLVRWAINAVALYAAIAIVPGIVPQSTNWLSFIWMALIFGLLNALLRPLIKLLTCPLIILTLGLGTLILNTVMLYLLQWAAGFFNIGFSLANFWSAFLGALVVSVVSVVLTMVFKEDSKKR